MRNLLFVAASTSHATWLCLAFGCTSCDPLGRTLLSARTYLGDPGNCQFSFGGRTPIAVSTRHTHWRGG